MDEGAGAGKGDNKGTGAGNGKSDGGTANTTTGGGGGSGHGNGGNANVSGNGVLVAGNSADFVRKRTKTRSKQKNIRKDNRPLDQRPDYRPLTFETKKKMGTSEDAQEGTQE